MAELKTKKTTASVVAFLRNLEDKEQRAEAKKLLAIFKSATGMKPAMWGTSIVGFGTYHYKSDRSTQEGDWPLTGFAPRKGTLTLYVGPGMRASAPLMKKLGKYKISGSCLHIKRMSDVDVPTLSTIIKRCVQEMRKLYKA